MSLIELLRILEGKHTVVGVTDTVRIQVGDEIKEFPLDMYAQAVIMKGFVPCLD